DPEELPELLFRDIQRALDPVDVDLLEGRHRRPPQRLRDPARRRDRMRAAVDPEARLADRVAVGLDLEPDPYVQDLVLGLAGRDARPRARHVPGTRRRVESPFDLGAVIHSELSSLAENGVVCQTSRAPRRAPLGRTERET